MNTFLQSPGSWAQIEFGPAWLGDPRRTKRLVHIASHLAASPSGTLPQAFPDWAQLKAAYRFFGQHGVSFESILAPHLERTRHACRQPGEHLIIEDTTQLDYSTHPATQNLGVIGDGGGRGFALHSALAVRIESWTLEQHPEGTVTGLFGQECRAPRPAPRGETRRQRLSRPRQSQTWAAAFKSAGRPPEGAQWIYVADRESDFYEPMRLCQQHGVDFIIRCGQQRRLAREAGTLLEALDRAPVLGQATVALRARAGQPARSAPVALRTCPVTLNIPWRPGGKLEPLAEMNVVEVREMDPPAGVKQPLHWKLLTSLPCATAAQLQRVVGRYTARWWIEEYHKALKSGAHVEASQLGHADRLESLIAVLAVVAVRLLSTKLLARGRPQTFEAAASFGPELLTLLERRHGPPAGGWTNENVLRAMARLGGFLARKNDGPPGWQTIWRGWQRLMWMHEGATPLPGKPNTCG